jgi:hypothetical protein
MASRLKIAAALLLIAGCARLAFSSFDLYAQGSFRIPMHVQLLGPYVVLILAVARVRSERVGRWLLVYVSMQVVFTFITCYELPRTLASVLETRIPYIGLAQLAAAVLALAAAEWHDRRIITPQQLLFGFLIALNVSTLLLVEVFKSKLEDAREWLIDERIGQALQQADADFKSGRIRQYEFHTIVSPADSSASGSQRTFSGRTNGPFEIWSVRRYAKDEDESFWLNYDSKSVDFYNARMAALYRWSQSNRSIRNATNAP